MVVSKVSADHSRGALLDLAVGDALDQMERYVRWWRV